MDRKALTREYKETRRPMGVFRVRNVAQQRSLVGVSRDLPAILNRHQAQLRMGSHNLRDLQRDWQELGPEAFRFEILDTLEPSEELSYDPGADLETLEKMWKERLLEEGEQFYQR